MSPNLGMVSNDVIPPPIGGINGTDPLIGMGQQYAIFSYNMVSSAYGLKIRNGYDEWCTSVDGNTTDDSVKSLLVFNGATTSKLFAATDEGIYDVTSSSTSPTKVVTFSTHSSVAGRMEWVNTVNSAGTHYLCCCDAANGYYHRTEGATWTKLTSGGGAGQVSGVDPANLVFVMQWKERLWFVERDTANAWYLATGAIEGAATKFAFGNKFKTGGTLVGLYSWSRDGGTGPDDYLVAISSSGDVVVYQGTDPSSTDSFQIVGNWFVGSLPLGRRIAAKVGGDLWILSLFGIIPLSKLLAGLEVKNKDAFVTGNITPIFTSLMTNRTSTFGWEIRTCPQDSLLFVSVPKLSTASHTQLVYSMDRPAWTLFRDIPYLCGQEFVGEFYIGTSDGRVLKYTGHTDNGADINWSLMGAYRPTKTNTMIGFSRPFFVTSAIPVYEVQARYDYDLNEFYSSLVAPASAASSGWDSGLWDSALWGGLASQNTPRGVSGMGRAVAMALRGKSNLDTTYLGMEVIFQQGGML